VTLDDAKTILAGLQEVLVLKGGHLTQRGAHHAAI